MSSDEKDREVYWDENEGKWYYTAALHIRGAVMSFYPAVSFGPYDTEEQATEAMRLHGLEE
jgi:hypothetical protein